MSSNQLLVSIDGPGPYGIRFGVEKKFITVFKIRNNSKAKEAGLVEKDIVLAVNGFVCQNLNVNIVTSLMEYYENRLEILLIRGDDAPFEAGQVITSLDILRYQRVAEEEILNILANKRNSYASKGSTYSNQGCDKFLLSSVPSKQTSKKTILIMESPMNENKSMNSYNFINDKNIYNSNKINSVIVLDTNFENRGNKKTEVATLNKSFPLYYKTKMNEIFNANDKSTVNIFGNALEDNFKVTISSNNNLNNVDMITDNHVDKNTFIKKALINEKETMNNSEYNQTNSFINLNNRNLQENNNFSNDTTCYNPDSLSHKNYSSNDNNLYKSDYINQRNNRMVSSKFEDFTLFPPYEKDFTKKTYNTTSLQLDRNNSPEYSSKSYGFYKNENSNNLNNYDYTNDFSANKSNPSIHCLNKNKGDYMKSNDFSKINFTKETNFDDFNSQKFGSLLNKCKKLDTHSNYSNNLKQYLNNADTEYNLNHTSYNQTPEKIVKFPSYLNAESKIKQSYDESDDIINNQINDRNKYEEKNKEQHPNLFGYSENRDRNLNTFGQIENSKLLTYKSNIMKPSLIHHGLDTNNQETNVFKSRGTCSNYSQNLYSTEKESNELNIIPLSNEFQNTFSKFNENTFNMEKSFDQTPIYQSNTNRNETEEKNLPFMSPLPPPPLINYENRGEKLPNLKYNIHATTNIADKMKMANVMAHSILSPENIKSKGQKMFLKQKINSEKYTLIVNNQIENSNSNVFGKLQINNKPKKEFMENNVSLYNKSPTYQNNLPIDKDNLKSKTGHDTGFEQNYPNKLTSYDRFKNNAGLVNNRDSRYKAGLGDNGDSRYKTLPLNKMSTNKFKSPNDSLHRSDSLYGLPRMSKKSYNNWNPVYKSNAISFKQNNECNARNDKYNEVPFITPFHKSIPNLSNNKNCYSDL